MPVTLRFSFLVLLLAFAAPICVGQDDLRIEALELGNDYAARGSWEEALNEYEAAIAGQDATSRKAYTKIGLVHLRKAREYQRAEAFGYARLEADFALDVFKAYQPRWLPTVHTLRANLALAGGDPFDALAAFNAGLRSFHSLPDAALPRPHPDSLSGDQLVEATQLLGGRAGLLAGSDRPLEALADYEWLFYLQDLRRQEVAFTDDRTFLNLPLRQYFDRAIDLVVGHAALTEDENLLWDAVTLTARAKQYDLLYFLQQQRANRGGRVQRLTERQSVLRDLVKTDQRYAPALESIGFEIDRLQYLKPKTSLSRNVRPIDRGVMAELRTSDRTLAIFHVGSEASHLFVLDPIGDRITHRVIDRSEILLSAVRDFRDALMIGEGEPDDTSFLPYGAILHEKLFDSLGVATPNLIIVPDGPLTFVPFAALPITGQDQTSPDGAIYLSDRHTISYLYSAGGLLSEQDRQRPNYSLDLLALFGATSPESSRIGATFPEHKILNGREANRENFLAEAGTARIIHLDAPGTIDAANPARSALDFSASGSGAEAELETLLSLGDLVTTSLQARLVALPNTTVSLAGVTPNTTAWHFPAAIVAAGAESSLSTLWPSPSGALISGFYDDLGRSVPRGEALSAAQAGQRNRVHPYYWAGYQLYGNAGVLKPGLENRGGGRGPYLIGGLVLLLTGAVLVWKYFTAA